MTRLHLSLVAAVLAAATFGACNCNPITPPAGDVCGTGTVDGAPYAVDPAGTRALLVVSRKDGAGCGVFHSHVVKATVGTIEYALNSADLGASTVKVTLLAAGLDVDDPQLRAELLPEGENQPLSDGDRQSIRGSVAEEVLAHEHPTLVFTLSKLSAADGAGTATMKAELAGATSDVGLDYTVTKEGTTYKVTGTASLDGAPYGIPRNSLGFCVEQVMQVRFDIVLVPAAQPVVCEGAEPPPAYEPQFFDDTECADAVGYNEVRDVAVRRCAGCHAAELRLGATVPLIEWEDWRSDSLRNPGRPLYQTAHDYVHLAPDQGLSMPPVDPVEPLATALTAEEIAVFDAWVEGGARNAACANDPGPTTFAERDFTAKQCDDVLHYTSPDAEGNTAKSFFDNNCSYCHQDGTGRYVQVPQVSLLDDNGDFVIDDETGGPAVDHVAAAAGVLHPYYLGAGSAPLSFWEASVLRVEDLSMTPNAGFDMTQDPSFLQFKAWVEAGAAPAPCN